MLGPEGVRLREVRLYSDHLDNKKRTKNCSFNIKVSFDKFKTFSFSHVRENETALLPALSKDWTREDGGNRAWSVEYAKKKTGGLDNLFEI